jgi:hypothetical protein
MSTLTARKGGAGSKPNAVTASINAADAKATTVAQARDANSQLPSPTLLLPLTVTTLVLAVYSATVYPSVTGGDSGELLITTCNLGIAHPPGYPTYTMVGWAWLQLTDLFFPKAQKAYRINLLCATFGAIAAGFISWTAATLAARTAIGRYTSASPQSSANRWSSYLVGFFSGVGFALMPTVWLYSIQGEVFALNNLLCSILTALTVRYYRAEVTVERQQERLQRTAATKKEGEGKSVDVSEIFSSAAAASAETSAAASSASFVNPRTLVSLAYLGAFVCGLCLTNQHTTVFPVFVTAAFITWSLFSHGLLSPMRVVLLILSVVVGFSPYAFILIRSHWNVMDSSVALRAQHCSLLPVGHHPLVLF